MYSSIWRHSHISQNYKGQRQRQVAPYVTMGGGNILRGVLPPLFVGCVRFMGSDKAKAGTMFAPAHYFVKSTDLLVFRTVFEGLTEPRKEDDSHNDECHIICYLMVSNCYFIRFRYIAMVEGLKALPRDVVKPLALSLSAIA